MTEPVGKVFADFLKALIVLIVLMWFFLNFLV